MLAGTLALKDLLRGWYVIILINGSFGVGKTTTAQALVNALPNAFLFDPEEEIYRRIRARGEQPEGDWVFEQVPRCVRAFDGPGFETKIEVQDMTPENIAERILVFAGLR